MLLAPAGLRLAPACSNYPLENLKTWAPIHLAIKPSGPSAWSCTPAPFLGLHSFFIPSQGLRRASQFVPSQLHPFTIECNPPHTGSPPPNQQDKHVSICESGQRLEYFITEFFYFIFFNRKGKFSTGFLCCLCDIGPNQKGCSDSRNPSGWETLVPPN